MLSRKGNISIQYFIFAKDTAGVLRGAIILIGWLKVFNAELSLNGYQRGPRSRGSGVRVGGG